MRKKKGTSIKMSFLHNMFELEHLFLQVLQKEFGLAWAI